MPQLQGAAGADQDECPVCAKVVHAAVHLDFASPVALCQAHTGATGPGLYLDAAGNRGAPGSPYLTAPLVDKVLIPIQNGQAVANSTIALYLAALLGAALLALGPELGQDLRVGLDFERIAADLRTTTYDHLMRLSLEYFGGKRTGDLLSRVGSESDRIAVYLSLHLTDFASDVIMIVMTAAVLFTMDPSLALMTLVPLPFIGWMIHFVRYRLRTGF